MKRLSFLLNVLHCCQKSVGHTCMELYLGSVFYSINIYLFSSAIPYHLYYCSYIVDLILGIVTPFTVFFLILF